MKICYDKRRKDCENISYEMNGTDVTENILCCEMEYMAHNSHEPRTDDTLEIKTVTTSPYVVFVLPLGDLIKLTIKNNNNNTRDEMRIMLANYLNRPNGENEWIKINKDNVYLYQQGFMNFVICKIIERNLIL